MIEHIGAPSLARRIRRWMDDLFTSRLVRELETQLLQTKIDKDAQIGRLLEEKKALQGKIEKLELAIWPLSSRAGAVYAQQVNPPKPMTAATIPLTKFEQIYADELRKNAEADAQEAAAKEKQS